MASSRDLRRYANEGYVEADNPDEDWTEPNLTEPKLQDELNRRRGRQRPRAARRDLKSAPGDEEAPANQQEMTQIRYFKYIPYRGMSGPERRKYLSLGPARLTSSRTEPTPRQHRPTTVQRPDGEASYWPSASKAKSLKVFDYHLAELSLAYRSPPSLLSVPRRLATPPSGTPRRQEQEQQQEQQEKQTARTTAAAPRSLFYQIHSNRAVPASAPTVTQRQLTLAEKTTQISRGCTPFIESALSDNFPTEPGDLVNKSESNRLLNVVSVDECHVRHRRRRRRLRRVNVGQATEAAGEGEDDEEEDWDEEEAEEAVEELADEDQCSSQDPAAPPEPDVDQAEPPPSPLPAQAEHRSSDAYIPSSTSTRPNTERRKSKRRSDKEMRQLAAAKFQRRNEILREKMAIYLDWKLNQERMGVIDVRDGSAAARFERFTVELVHQEALVANQYRGVGPSDSAVTDTLAHDYPTSPRMLMSLRQQGGAASAAVAQNPELSLTEMFDALNV